MWSYWIVDTRTGVKQIQVEPSSASWSRLLNAGGKGTHRFVLTEDSVMRDKGLTVPWSRTLVQCWDDTPIYAGLVVSRTYSRDDHTLTVESSDVRALLSRRYPFGTGSYWANEALHIPGHFAATNLTPRAAASLAIAAGTAGPYPIYSLPITRPSSSEAGSFTKVWENYNFVTVADLLEDIQELEGGPDIDFEPQWSSSGVLVWGMRAGSPAAPQLSASLFEFNMSAEEPRLTGVKLTDDGAKQLTGVFSVGAGSEVDMRVGGWGAGTSASIPAIDVVQAHKDEESEPLLASYSRAQVAAHTFPTRQWEMGMLASVEPGLAAMRLGSILRMLWSGDVWVDESRTDVRVVSMSGTHSEKVTLDVQPWGA